MQKNKNIIVTEELNDFVLKNISKGRYHCYADMIDRENLPYEAQALKEAIAAYRTRKRQERGRNYPDRVKNIDAYLQQKNADYSDVPYFSVRLRIIGGAA